VTNLTAEPSLRSYTRIAGLTYVLVILLGILSVSYVDSSIVVPGNDAATIENMSAHELRFRLSVAGEIVMYALVIVLSFSLFVILETVHKNLALLALLLRLAEAIAGCGVVVLSGLVPLLFLESGGTLEAEPLQALVGLFLQIRSAGLDVVLLFVGAGGTIFCYLFYVSRYVPRILAGWGIVTYVSMLTLSLASLLTPHFSETIKMVFFAPGALFEIVFGLWLLVRGISIRQME